MNQDEKAEFVKDFEELFIRAENMYLNDSAAGLVVTDCCFRLCDRRYFIGQYKFDFRKDEIQLKTAEVDKDNYWDAVKEMNKQRPSQ